MKFNHALLSCLFWGLSFTGALAGGDRPLEGEILRLSRDAAEVRTRDGDVVSVPLTSMTYVYEQQTVAALAALSVGAQVKVVHRTNRTKEPPVTYTMIYIVNARSGQPGS